MWLRWECGAAWQARRSVDHLPTQCCSAAILAAARLTFSTLRCGPLFQCECPLPTADPHPTHSHPHPTRAHPHPHPHAGDLLRALRCGHRFHCECVDRWLLSATDYSRPPACPMCNAELTAEPRQG